MKTQYYTATSLDGFIADSDNSLSWLFQLGDGPGGNYDQFIAEVGALAMGATTYEWLLQHMINPGADMPQAWPYSMPSWVFTSRTLPGVPGADIRFTRAPIPEVHAEMVAAAAGKKCLDHGRRRSGGTVSRSRLA